MENIKKWLNHKGYRHIVTLIFILPILIVIVLCGLKIYDEAKSMLGNVTGQEIDSTTKQDNVIEYGGSSYTLRENPTDVQKEYFKELKEACGNSDGSNDSNRLIAELVIKNYISDLYTFSNKYGQYDVSCLSYLYEYQKNELYVQIRDQFYKYINNYINEYGADNLIEVENVEVTVDDSTFEFSFEIDEDKTEYDAYNAVATWNYVQKDSKFNTSQFATKCYFVVAVRGAGKLEIVYAGDTPYQKNVKVEETNE